MTAVYIALAACPAIFLSTATFLVLIVVGVHRGDRSDLRSPANDRIDAITRRVVGVGARNSASKEGES
jgi:hypothetical protein